MRWPTSGVGGRITSYNVCYTKLLRDRGDDGVGTTAATVRAAMARAAGSGAQLVAKEGRYALLRMPSG